MSSEALDEWYREIMLGEPTDDIRAAARVARQIYVAYLEVGFDQEESMFLLLEMLGVART